VDSTPTIDEARTRVSGRRLVAHIVDGMVITVVVLAFAFVLGLIIGGLGAFADDATTSSTEETALGIAVFIAAGLGTVAYFVLTQRRHGRTPGKASVGIRVVDEHGGTPTTAALVKRTVPLFFEWLYVIAAIGMLRSPYRQRFGDRWAHTYVIRG